MLLISKESYDIVNVTRNSEFHISVKDVYKNGVFHVIFRFKGEEKGIIIGAGKDELEAHQLAKAVATAIETNALVIDKRLIDRASVELKLLEND